jgi:glycosyltransferase involved in cell wall biosynthesis
VSATLTVSHVVLSLDCGGLEHVVLSLVREGTRAGQRVSVVCLERPGTLATEAERLGARVHCIDKRPGLRLSTARRLQSLFQELRPHVVHTHQIGALLYAGPAARRSGVRVVVHTEHGKHYSVRRKTRWLGRIVGRTAQRFFCVSDDIAAEVNACRIVPARKIQVVSNGIDTQRFRQPDAGAGIRGQLGIPVNALVVGTVGRLSEIKRQDLLIQAFARVHTNLPDARLLIVGDGPQRIALHDLACRLRVDRAVHFAGYQDRPETFLRAMDVFALTSRSEGMPLVILEAWAAQVPVVASDVGGLPAMIDHNRTGLLFRSGDVVALESSLLTLLTNHDDRRRISIAALCKVVDRFDVRRMAQNYEVHYRQLLRPRPVCAV